MINAIVAEKIVKYCQTKNYILSINPGEINIVYVEGMDTDGDVNSDEPNSFNDARIVFDSALKPIQVWSATTEPGRWYTNRPMNPNGAFRIAFGQYKAWRVGMHGTSDRHEALVQVAEIEGHRDADKNMVRTGDRKVKGLFGVNQHWGYDLPPNDIGKASAGCLVGRTRKGHQEFMQIVKSDPRYRSDKTYVFRTIVLPGNELV